MSYEQAKAIFTEALKREGDDRAAYLEDACAGQPELLQEIRLLLDRHASTVVDPPKPRIAGEYEKGDQVGPFTIREQLGSGGMGAVYLASQSKPVRRLVALKVIKPGFDTSNTLARFQAARQALAMMDHPGIARVLEAGATETGRPWFAMEYIKGLDLNEYCNQNRLETSQRLELFMQVCDAVQHAHQKGIIHRDLKPSNLLIMRDEQDRPQVKIIDFGIAKAVSTPLTDMTLHTSIGQLVGTLSYMSPEQVRGSDDIDTRTDVYSLGVILYELLSGRVPFASQTKSDSNQEDLKHSIRELDPPHPSTQITSFGGEDATNIARSRRTSIEDLQKTLKKELEWIPMKALRKDRSERYSSPESLREDCERYLAGEPLEAGPISRAYRWKKYFRRHKVQVATVASFILLLMGATVVSITLWLQAVEAEVIANKAQANAREQARQAEAERASAEKAITFIDNMLREPARKVLPNLSDITQKMTLSFGINAPVQQAIAALEDMMFQAGDRIGNEFADNPIYEATIRNALGHFQLALGNDMEGKVEIEKALQIRQRELGADHPETLDSLSTLGLYMWYLEEYDVALDYYRKAVTSSQAAESVEDDTRNELINTLGRLLYIRGVNIQREQRVDQAMSHYEEAHDLYQQYWGDDHSMTVSMKNVIDSMSGPWAETQRAQADAIKRARERAELARQEGSRSGRRSRPREEDKRNVSITLYSPEQIMKMNRQELMEQLSLVSKASKDATNPAMAERFKEQARLLLIALQSISND